MTRRRFAGLMLAAAGAAVAGGWRWMRAQMPRRVVEAACGGRYPGRVRPLDLAEARRPARWEG